MRRISESLPALLLPASEKLSPLALQARLLGISGLLPADVLDASAGAQTYWRTVWDLWWRERESFADLALPPSLWRLGGLRPANNPQRRLALAAHWLVEMDFPSKLTEWFGSAEPGSKACQTLARLLQSVQDEFWSRHWSFRSAPIPQPQPLIGPQRVTDLAINVVLPWFWIRADLGQNEALRQRAEDCYFAWPKAEDNAVLRLARRRFFGTARGTGPATAASQQGLLQVVRDFCDYSNAVCENCPFPGLVGAC